MDISLYPEMISKFRQWYDAVWLGMKSMGRQFHKPKVILINGREVPEPLRTPLMIDDPYWTITFYGVCGFSWGDSEEDNEALKAGFIHLTKEAAQKHYEALKSFTFKEDSNECSSLRLC